MRTVSTALGTAAALSCSALGLAVAREDAHESAREEQSEQMIAVSSPSRLLANPLPPAAHDTRPHNPHLHFDVGSRYSSVTPQTRPTRFEAGKSDGTATSGRSSKRRSSLMQGRGDETDGSGSRTHTRPWLRRLSSSMSTSRDSITPSRPGSSALSLSNGSIAFSHTGSMTPILPDGAPAPLPPNKLVKRPASLRSTTGSNSSGSASRLPLPIFRRPATSHQRSATLQDSLLFADSSDRMSIDQKSDHAHDRGWQHYFTPRMGHYDGSSGRRRSSTGIPNPIKRVYPDRRYIPVLVPAKEVVRVANLEMDDSTSLSGDEEAMAQITGVASSPLPSLPSTFGDHPAPGGIPKRSFSISDLLSTGPQPLWRRPSSAKGKGPGSRFSRKDRSRLVSAPQPSMGSAFSAVTGNDAERPAKRRDTSDPQLAHRSIYSSSGSQRALEEPRQEIQLNLGSSTPQSQHFSFISSPAGTPPLIATPSPFDAPGPYTNGASKAPKAALRPSATQSETTMSTVESDSEHRSIGEYSTDNQSDTIFDSIPTRTTRSSTGKRGPPIDTIFDESPRTFSSGRSTKLGDLLRDGSFSMGDHGARYRHSIIEEEGSTISTPVRSLRDQSVTSTPSARPVGQLQFASSPPVVSIMPDPDDIDWDSPQDDEAGAHGLGLRHYSAPHSRPLQQTRFAPLRFNDFGRSSNVHSVQSTPNRYSSAGADRANLFDWAEAQPSPNHASRSPPRPRTVHGKKNPESRGSRTSGRRGPGGMHARSHSVPVVPDVDGKRTAVANKFGTWGVGTKGVTEDWNDDFDFDNSSLPQEDAGALQDEKRVDSGHAMLVPRSIREQQEHVVANIGLLREWGLLIEELKALRIRAVALDMLIGPYARDWREVDAMIELADQESEEKTLEPRRSPPSSPGFDYDDFEDSARESMDLESNPESAARPSQAISFENDPGLSPSHDSPSRPYLRTTRPRKDSEAVARSVIEALQSKRDQAGSNGRPLKKVPFDTATLRHIVPYVKDLKRKVKDALRETEGLNSSPQQQTPPDVTMSDDESDDEPAFRSIFSGPESDSPTASRSRREAAITDNDGWNMPTAPRVDLAAAMNRMTLAPR